MNHIQTVTKQRKSHPDDLRVIAEIEKCDADCVFELDHVDRSEWGSSAHRYREWVLLPPGSSHHVYVCLREAWSRKKEGWQWEGSHWRRNVIGSERVGVDLVGRLAKDERQARAFKLLQKIVEESVSVEYEDGSPDLTCAELPYGLIQEARDLLREDA